MPARTCAVCRVRGERDELLRLVADGEGRVRFDAAGSAPGRGAWIHPRCVAALGRKPGVLARALRRQATVPPELPNAIRAALDAEIARARASAERLGLCAGDAVARSRRTRGLQRKMTLRGNLD